jgi:hypothetical protein
MDRLINYHKTIIQMQKYTDQTVGDILLNAPVQFTSYLDVADGILCKCDTSANSTGAIVSKSATIALPTAPTTKIVDAIKYTDHNGVAQVFTFSRQYLFSTLSVAGIYTELNKEVVALFSRFLVGSGNANAGKVSNNLVVKVTARTPFTPTFLVVDGVDIAFV